jgi:hypothetical protein
MHKKSNSNYSSNDIPLTKKSSNGSIDINYLQKLEKINKRNSYNSNTNSYDSSTSNKEKEKDRINAEILKKNIQVSKFEMESRNSNSSSSSKSSNLDLGKILDNITNNYGYGWETIRAFIACFLIDYCLSLIIFHSSSYIKILEKNFSYLDLKKNKLAFFSSLIGFSTYGLGSFTLIFISRYFPQSRKLVIFISFILILISCLINSILFNFYTYFVFFIFGCFFSGLTNPINQNILCEFLPVKLRGFFFCLSNLGKPLAKLTHYLLIKIIYDENKINSMNLLQGICTGIFFIFGTAAFILLRNSPRNLIISNDEETSFEILNKMLPKIKSLKSYEKNIIIKESSKGLNDKSIGYISELFGSLFLNSTLIFSGIIFLIKFFENGFSSILISFIKDLILLRKTLSVNSNTAVTVISNENEVIEKIQFVLMILGLFGPFLSGIFIEIKYLGRKFTLLSSIFLLLFSYILLHINPTNSEIWLGFSLILSDISFYCILTLITETYSTIIRDIALGYIYTIISFSAISGFLIFIVLYDLSKMGPFYFQIASSILSIFLISFITYETCNKDLDCESFININNKKRKSEEENDIENLNLKDNPNFNDNYIDNVKY